MSMSIERTLARLALAATLALTLALPAHAQRDDKKQPINYSADSGDVNYQSKVGNLAGNVIITQGSMTIRADRIKFRQNPDNSISATAYGNPITFRQKREGFDEYIEGFSDRLEDDGKADKMQMFTNARIQRGGDEVRGDYISYNAVTEFFQVIGGGKSAATPGNPQGRVRAVIQPKPKPGAEGASGSPGAAGKPLDLRPSEGVKPAQP